MYENTKTPATNSSAAPTAAHPESMDRVASVSKSAHSGIDAASDAARPTIDRMASAAHKVVETADEVAANAVEALGDAGVKGEEWLASGTDYVREHPLLTLGIAVAAGYVLSRLLAPR